MKVSAELLFIRLFDFILSSFGIILLSPIILLLLFFGYIDTRDPIFKQKRLGRNKVPFLLFKFRSMSIETESMATHLVDASLVTNYGKFLRISKLDELPQLFNVLIGDMSIVGPRPNLLNQDDLISERDKRGVYIFRPGITGLAQIKKIDMSTPVLLAETDEKMIKHLDVIHYFKYIFLTIFGSGFGDRVKNH